MRASEQVVPERLKMKTMGANWVNGFREGGRGGRVLGIGGSLLITVGLLSACGSSSSSSSSTTAASAASASSSGSTKCSNSSGSVTFGFLGAYTGNEGFLGPDMMKGVQAARAEINAAGGVLGCQLTFTTGDTANDPVDAVPAYRKMASQHVPVIIGPTSEGESALPDMKRAQIPTFIQGGTTALDNVTGNPYFWRTTPSDSVQAAAMAAYAIQKGWTRAAVAFTNDVGSTPLIAPLLAAFKKGGGTIVANESLVPDQAGYQSSVAALAASKPQVVFLQLDPQTAGTFFNEVQSAGFDSQTNWIGTNVEATSDVFKAIGAKVATTNMYMTNGVSEGGQNGAAFNKWYKKVNNTTTPANLSQEAYDATIIAALATDMAKKFSGADINNQIIKVANPPGTACYSYSSCLSFMNAGKKINYQGVASNDDFNQYHNVFGPFGVYQWTASGGLNSIATISAGEIAKLG